MTPAYFFVGCLFLIVTMVRTMVRYLDSGKGIDAITAGSFLIAVAFFLAAGAQGAACAA